MLPTKSKLDQTRSDIVGDIFYKFEDKFELNYNFSYDRDLNFSNYDALNAKFSAIKWLLHLIILQKIMSLGIQS